MDMDAATYTDTGTDTYTDAIADAVAHTYAYRKLLRCLAGIIGVFVFANYFIMFCLIEG